MQPPMGALKLSRLQPHRRLCAPRRCDFSHRAVAAEAMILQMSVYCTSCSSPISEPIKSCLQLVEVWRCSITVRLHGGGLACDGTEVRLHDMGLASGPTHVGLERHDVARVGCRWHQELRRRLKSQDCVGRVTGPWAGWTGRTAPKTKGEFP